jgi:predicted transposase/invertase (TIGR01784 family)
VEVKQLAFRIDGVFLPQKPELPIYFVEVQFQRDTKFYSRFFSELLLYLHQTDLNNNWKGVIIYPQRSLDIGNKERYEDFLLTERVKIIYLDELPSEELESSLEMSILDLIISQEKKAIEKGKEIVKQVRIKTESEVTRENLIRFIETILIYKLPTMSYKELEKMFSLGDLRETKAFQEAFELAKEEVKENAIEEGKELKAKEAIPPLLALGLTVKQIAQALNLSEEIVKQIAENQKNQG